MAGGDGDMGSGSPSFGDIESEYFRAFSAGYGPDRYDILGTVNTSNPWIQNIVGIGGAAYSLTPLFSWRMVGTGWKYGTGESTNFSHWVPYRILRDTNKWLYEQLGLPVKAFTDSVSKRSLTYTFWNGNTVNQKVHLLSDPFVKSGRKLFPNTWPKAVNLGIVRVPAWIWSEAMGLLYRSGRYGNQ